jgi:hypothetical protein
LTQDQGDGQLALVPVGPDEPRVLDDMVRHLDSLLGLYNRGRMRDSRMRLRLGFDSGVAYPAALGFAGPAVVAASRLVGCDELRAALVAADDANLVVIASPTAFEIVTLGHTTLDARQFRRVDVHVKEYRSEAWIWAPGVPGFPGVPGGGGVPVAEPPEPRPGPQPWPAPMPVNNQGASIGNQFNAPIHGDVTVGAPPRDHWRDGLSQLRQGNYREAAASFGRRLAEDGAGPEVHYYLALALIGSRPPRDHPSVNSIVGHLERASALAEARLLWLVVDEDHRPGRRRDALPNPLMYELIRLITPAHALEIVGQFRATNSPTWQALASRAREG